MCCGVVLFLCFCCSWYTLDIFLGTLFGIGFGAFATMDWAMATDVLPHPHEFAKDMGIWSLAIVLPQVQHRYNTTKISRDARRGDVGPAQFNAIISSICALFNLGDGALLCMFLFFCSVVVVVRLLCRRWQLLLLVMCWIISNLVLKVVWHQNIHMAILSSS